MPANLVRGPGRRRHRALRREVRRQPELRRDRGDERRRRRRRRPRRRRRRRHGGPTARQVFASAGCGGCHTLKAAGSTGNVGPNLDQLKPSEATVAHQVEVGGGAMPPFKGQLSAARSRPSRSTSPPSPASKLRRSTYSSCRARGTADSPARSRRSQAPTSRSSRRSCAPCASRLRREQRAVVRLARQELREQRAADAARAGTAGRTCSSTISKCGGSSHSLALRRR